MPIKKNCFTWLEKSYKNKPYKDWNIKSVNGVSSVIMRLEETSPEMAILYNLFTHKDFRKKGNAEDVLCLAALTARIHGIRLLFLKVKKGTWMYNWYQRLGFKDWESPLKTYQWMSLDLQKPNKLC